MPDNINREYKDRLFAFIFGNPANKKWALELYNALNGSNFTSEQDLTFTTIENVVYMKMKNDVSFLVGNTMSFYEQQSTHNPNMPLRFFLYAGMVYSEYAEKNVNLFGEKLYAIPTPKCVCFYNGSERSAEKSILRLSDAYEGEGDIEVTVTVYNINHGHSKELLSACKPLYEYSWFVGEVRENSRVLPLAEAVEKTIEKMPDDFRIKEFLVSNRAGVTMMCLTEFDEEKCLEFTREEGRAEGEIEGRVKTLIELAKEGELDYEKAQKKSGLTAEEFKALYDKS